ncbi:MULTISPECIES: hypothetical protein [unclassified Aureispira]|uniref:hypothetical protein n=1 Tax=unclassified Aureispira TaxID=2649989 RepID=UPI000697F596|nr:MULTISPECIES: hypothetical protein [unclassified Aureispira]WMX16176.1 hypothetical protein QP953_07345 [Aureispira sp. CCB-E]
MKLSNVLIVCIFIAMGLMACETPKEPTIKDVFPKQLDLLQHGIPIKIQAPEDAKVTNRSDNFMQDVVIEGTDYYVQIYSQGASSPQCTAMATEALDDIKKTNPTFQKTILEEDCGFIYEVQIPGDSTKCFNFNYFAVKGNKSFSFSTTTGRRQPFSKEEVEHIYQAVKEQE